MKRSFLAFGIAATAAMLAPLGIQAEDATASAEQNALTSSATFSCRSHRVCELSCKDIVNGNTVERLNAIREIAAKTDGNVVMFSIKRDGNEPALITVSNRAVCRVVETGSK